MKDKYLIIIIFKIMKRLILFPIVLLSVMVSCKKDAPLSEAIIGKWEVVSISLVTYKDNVKKNETTYFLGVSEMAVQFATGGTGIYYENNDVFSTFSWTLSGTTITIPGATTPQTWEVTLDNNTLVWSFYETETTDSVVYKYEYIYTSTKSS
jgi:hypothetical protein